MEKQLFNIIEPSQNLKISILNKIKREEKKKTIYKIAFSSVISLFSILLAVIFTLNIIRDAYQSGLSEYLSLLISDGVSIASYWQTYTMSVVESLPIVPITMVIASIWIFVWSINTIIENYKNTKRVIYRTS